MLRRHSLFLALPFSYHKAVISFPRTCSACCAVLHNLPAQDPVPWERSRDALPGALAGRGLRPAGGSRARPAPSPPSRACQPRAARPSARPTEQSPSSLPFSEETFSPSPFRENAVFRQLIRPQIFFLFSFCFVGLGFVEGSSLHLLGITLPSTRHHARHLMFRITVIPDLEMLPVPFR